VDLHSWLCADHGGILDRLEESLVARVPAERWHERADGGGSSIAALALHLALHQDLAVTTVVRGLEPVVAEHREPLGLAGLSRAVGLSESEDPQVSALVSVEPLLAYVRAVFASTGAWLAELPPDGVGEVLDMRPNVTRRLETLAGLDPAEVPWLLRMWDHRPVSWLLMWPAIGHGHTHVGEATSVRNRLGLSPF
jgi:hypothetical protein